MRKFGKDNNVDYIRPTFFYFLVLQTLPTLISAKVKKKKKNWFFSRFCLLWHQHFSRN